MTREEITEKVISIVCEQMDVDRDKINLEVTPAADGADALAILTEWNEFRALDFTRLKALLKTPVLVDLRNIYDPLEMARAGFDYISVGRPPVRRES